MSNDRQKKIEEIFHQATGLEGKHRDLFIAENCCDDLMRHEVEKLLQYDHRYGGGLTEPVQDPFISRGETEKNGSTGDQQKQSLDSSSSGGIDHGRFLPGTILADRYRIVGMLGKGGMGEVFRADDLELGQSVALKFLPKRLADDAQSLERFRSEVRLARQVSHPNVCRVYDIGQIEGQWFLSMEYVDGEDLGLLLQRIGRFNSDRAIELARQLCLGLQAAHEKGVIHRDLKPANVMIDGRG